MDDKEKKYVFLPIIPIPFITKLDEILLELLPDEYRGAVDHYINAKIEMLKSIQEIINKRIEKLENKKKELKIKKEKVDVE